MKIVIDIEDELYQMCRDLLGDADPIERAIADGTPLPSRDNQLNKIRELVDEWQSDTWADTYLCMVKIAKLVKSQESEKV